MAAGFVAPSLHARVRGTNASDGLVGTTDPVDRIFARGEDVVRGAGGQFDQLYGGPGNDKLYGGAASNHLYGASAYGRGP